MAVHNFLAPATSAPLRRADVVLWIAEPDANGVRQPRHAGHAGLVAVAKARHSFGAEVVVYHMTDRFVAKHPWADGVLNGIPCCVDVSCTADGVEDLTRDDILKEANRLSQRRPSRLDGGAVESCYWLGTPDPGNHPLLSGVTGAYAFSCTTFVHYCYRAAGRELVPLDDVPLLTEEDRRFFTENGFAVQTGPVRRLACGHLICAFESENFPFRPTGGDWTPCGDHPVFRRFLPPPARPEPTAPPPADARAEGPEHPSPRPADTTTP